jgi:hypothetical protein
MVIEDDELSSMNAKDEDTAASGEIDASRVERGASPNSRAASGPKVHLTLGSMLILVSPNRAWDPVPRNARLLLLPHRTVVVPFATPSVRHRIRSIDFVPMVQLVAYQSS